MRQCPTKAATESKRICTDKVEWALHKLADLRSVELKGRDLRIFRRRCTEAEARERLNDPERVEYRALAVEPITDHRRRVRAPLVA